MAQVPEVKIGYDEIDRGSTHRHPVYYSNLSKALQGRIDELDLTLHELMKLNIVEDRITNVHLMKLSGIEVKAEDVPWPKI